MVSETRKIPWARISAEAVAIVVSILLAFAIDAWYERVVEQRLAAGYEQRLLAELEGVRTDLELLARTLRRAIAYSEEAAPFFSGEYEQIDGDRLVLALVNMGREYADPFDLSTYQDLLSSGRLGLIADDKRRALQRAYELVPRADSARYPYQKEYNLMVRAWIPTSVVREISETCSNIAAEDWACPTIDLDDAAVESALAGLWRSEQALLSFRARAQGLGQTAFQIDFIGRQIDEVLTALR